MRKIANTAGVLFILICFISCQKNNDAPVPHIVFVKGPGYVSADDTIAKGSILKVGVIAFRTQATEVLTKITEMVTYDNTIDDSLSSIPIVSNTIDSFEQDYTINTRNIPGIEKYVFTIFDQNGSTNSIKLMVRTK